MENTPKNKVDRKTVLIVDDTALNRALLSDILSHDYAIREATDGLEALEILNQGWTEISLVLLDVVMPRMGGLELLAQMNRNNWLQSIPVIMISADDSAANIDRAYDLGATDYITRPFDERTVQRRAQNTINLYAKQKVLENMVTEQIMEKERSNFQMVEILSNVVEFRNGESGAHVRHVRVITDVLLQTIRRRAPQYGLTSAQISVIANASALHDIGKISIDEKILNKPGKLTFEEFEIMKTHTVIGARMLEETPQQEGDDSFLHIAHDICRWHHERYDGRGYPDGLKGDEIPIAAQVVSLADVYDALTAPRVYKPAFSPEKAMDMILNGECGTFNPILLECLKECAGRLTRELELETAGPLNALEIRRVTSELMEHGELKASSQTLNLLERERDKFQFYAEMTEDIFFEYDRETHRLVFSEKGAQKLGISQVITQPGTAPEILELGAGMQRIQQRLETATAMAPDVQETCVLPTAQGRKTFAMTLRTLWDSGDSPSYSRVLGKLTECAE